MNGGAKARGYTIVEVMIVLAVTSLLLVSALRLVSGQQARTEFSQAVREMDSRIQDIINDVSTGYYTNNNNVSCTAGGSGPVLAASASDTQGTNQGCVFIGRVIQFAEQDATESKYRLYTVTGLRRNSSGTADASNLTEVEPRAIAKEDAASTVPDLSVQVAMPFGIKVKKMYFVDTSTGITQNDFGAVGFFSNFSSGGSTGGLKQGIRQTEIIPIPGTALDQTTYDVVKQVNLIEEEAIPTTRFVKAGGLSPNTPRNPTGGIIICLQHDGANQHANITIGSNGRQLTTTTEILSGGC